ncbi:MAG: HDIG domain-containing metalloprotein [Chloroflexota bacterium]
MNEESAGRSSVAKGSSLWLPLFAATLALSLTAILSLNLVTGRQVTAVLGEPATADMIAPESISFVSQVLTDRERERVAAEVPNEYALDLQIGRTQADKAQAIFSFVEVVRADPMADEATKTRYLQAIADVLVEEEVARALLALNQADYGAAKANVLDIIEQTMQGQILATQLTDVRRQARRLVSFDSTPTQESVVTNLAPQFIVTNSHFDEEATAQAKARAAGLIEPVRRTVLKGERVIRTGDIIDAADLEVLAEFGLLQEKTDWSKAVALLVASLLATTLITLYWQQYHEKAMTVERDLLLLLMVILLFLLAAKLMVLGGRRLPYLIPGAAVAMLLSVLYDVRFAIVITVILATLVGLISDNSLELASYTALGGLLATLTLKDTSRINAFFRAGVMASLGNIAVIIVFHFTQDQQLDDILQLFAFALANGLISASLTLAAFFTFGGLFGVLTTLQLQELSRLDHPLLQELLRRAPGTYHHSIMVANLAEQAAERVRANGALVRVGAFYHDVGKMNRPPFFTENQEGANPHDTLDPYSSARIIKSHVTDGLELARRHHLPHRIRDFIAEHHGDRLLKSFYKKAVEQAGGDVDQVDANRFRYPGPRPRSRETAIVQLADCIEATSSAVRPDTEAAIDKLVNSIVDDHLKEGQLDHSNLTLGDVKRLRASFSETLKGRFHVRVQYPGNEELQPAPAVAESALRPADNMPEKPAYQPL